MEISLARGLYRSWGKRGKGPFLPRGGGLTQRPGQTRKGLFDLRVQQLRQLHIALPTAVLETSEEALQGPLLRTGQGVRVFGQ